MSQPFHPPTPEQLQRHLDEHALHPPSPWIVWGPLIALAALMGLLLVARGPWAVVLPLLGLAGLLCFLFLRVRRARTLVRQTQQAHELAMLRHHARALGMGWRLIPRLVNIPAAYIRLLTLIGHCLDQLKQPEAAMIAFDRALDELPDDHPGGAHIRVQRALVALHADHLSDADDLLRRLRDAPQQYPETPLSAGFHFAELLQQVRTHHYDDPLNRDDWLDALRPLGVDAGFGHALLALCHQEARQHPAGDDAEARRQAVRDAWHRATALLPPAALVDRYPELSRVEETHPA